jgi:hypothetical protein
MTEETWERVALPLLRQIADAEQQHLPGLDMDAVARELGLPAHEVKAELDRLIEAGFVADKVAKHLGGSVHLASPRLSEKGARAVGMWPSNDPYDALLALLDRRLLDDSLGDEERTKLQRVRATLTDVGKSTVAGVLAALVKSGIGL